MSLNEDLEREHALGEPHPSLSGTTPGKPDHTGVSGQTLVVDTEQPTVKADLTERQAVEIQPMRYVLFVGLGLAILAMFVAWALFR